MLDRRRHYGAVMGDGVGGAKWYQDGHYFAGDGRYLFSNPGLAPPPGETLRSMAEAEASYQRQEEARIAPPVRRTPPPQPTPAQPQPPPPTAPVVEQAANLTRDQTLAQMGYFQLDGLIRAAGGESIKGKGAKQKMIEWLLENTSE